MADEQIGAFGVAGSGTTLVVPISAGKTADAGDKVLVVVATNAVSPETTSCQDDNGNSYTAEIPATSQGAGLRVSVFRRDIVGGSDSLEDSSNNNITITFSVTCNRKDAVIVKLQGLTAGAPDRQRSEGGSSTAPLATTTGALTVPCKVVGVCGAAAPASQPTLGFTPGTGFTEIADHALNGTTNRGEAVELKSQGAGAVATVDGTITTGAWLMFCLAYGVSGGTPYTVSLGGTIGPTGTVAKAISKSLGGTIGPSGALGKAVSRSLAGAIAPAGTLAKQTNKLLGGAITPAGTLAKQFARRFSGGLTPQGSLGKAIAKQLSGAITPAGTLATAKPGGISLGGTITPQGTIRKAISRQLGGTIGPTGLIGKAISKLLGGSVGSVGTLATQLSTEGEVFPDLRFHGDGSQGILIEGDGSQSIDFEGDGS